ncbi:hypothetical protein C4578_03405 [Candidatus Microgenomates bacterium]|jgi:hypothetical protein|nr:MAG: hypothetical protein C4578_03405 [Candidatus Microgenomates bacterium]
MYFPTRKREENLLSFIMGFPEGLTLEEIIEEVRQNPGKYFDRRVTRFEKNVRSELEHLESRGLLKRDILGKWYPAVTLEAARAGEAPLVQRQGDNIVIVIPVSLIEKLLKSDEVG